jgi:hypothetical protein
MSRRHHGRPHHPAHAGADGGRRVTGVSPSPAGPGEARNGHVNQAPAPDGSADAAQVDRAPSTAPATGAPINAMPANEAAPIAATASGPATDGVPSNGVPTNGASGNGVPANGMPRSDGRPRQPHNSAAPQNGAERTAAHAPAAPGSAGPGPGDAPGNPERNGQCTAPQLRRFIKSRPYVPMHELRRRFGIDGGDDDVTPVRLDPGWVYVGLPTREGSLLGDLLRAGEIGYELSLDPRTPIVIGVYPMRPIPRS